MLKSILINIFLSGSFVRFLLWQSYPHLPLLHSTGSVSDQHPEDQSSCIYEEKLLLNEVTEIIRSHNQSLPLFLLYSTHLVHMPLQAMDEGDLIVSDILR